MKKDVSKLEAIRNLMTHDHAILTPEYTRQVSTLFGLPEKDIPLRKIQDRRSEFKGAYFPDLKEGEWHDGCDASDLASSIAYHLKVPFQEMFGRGSQLRAACSAVESYLLKN